MVLKTDYVDSVYTTKKYEMTTHSAGVVSFRDTTVYSVAGDYYGAEDLNLQNLECNTLNADYAIIDELIAILVSHSVPVLSKAPSDILIALQADCANYFNEGRNLGHETVIANPSAYNMVSGTDYANADAAHTQYATKISNAKSLLGTNVPYTSYPDLPGLPVMSDPITTAQANETKSVVKNWLDGVLEAFTTFYASASSVLSQASTELRL